ncbi:hypothetical protein [Lentilactobacillus kosonis]|uniref:Uncharacterized protein n=1 Tax=Lentilactobacillus kosonis TaxID=2810561 RepID=A0A401FIG3_9LACO|nr:hypothetical protein [Lentilactobacillus kosonis]GAY72051.1 hypothetical protein NBRC111893_197 [Lentilactobacillus kosonis]
MKKVFLWGTVILGMFGILMTSTTNANAATWHKGVPTFLKSGFWNTHADDSYIQFTDQAVYYITPANNYYMAVIGTHPSYKKSNKTYTIRHVIYDNKDLSLKATPISHNKVKFSPLVPGKHIMTRISKLPAL